MPSLTKQVWWMLLITSKPGIYMHSTHNVVLRIGKYVAVEDYIVRSYIATVACFSSPALHRISAAAKTRQFLLVLLEGLNLLRTKLHSYTVNTKMLGSILNSGYKALLDVN